MAPEIIPAIILFLHNLFTAYWVGGMLVMLLAVTPSVKKSFQDKKEAMAFTRQLQQFLSLGVYVSIVGLFLTGLLLSNRAGADLLSITDQYSTVLLLKHITVVLMVVVTLVRSIVVERTVIIPAPKKPMVKMMLLVLNVLFGVLVLFFSSYLSVLS